MSTYTGVTNCQKTVRFFWPTLYVIKLEHLQMMPASADSVCDCAERAVLQ